MTIRTKVRPAGNDEDLANQQRFNSLGFVRVAHPFLRQAVLRAARHGEETEAARLYQRAMDEDRHTVVSSSLSSTRLAQMQLERLKR